MKLKDTLLKKGLKKNYICSIRNILKKLKLLSFSNSSDFNFYKEINNKNVAIVGPSFSTKSKGKEIDSYDLIIRTNYVENSNRPFKIYGKKITISYYNSFRTREKFHKVKKIVNHIEWMVFKSKNDLKKTKLNKEKIRVSFSPERLMFLSYPMSLQIMIYDILKFNPAKIKLFHFDFYSNPKSYNKNYKNFHQTVYHINNSLRSHDIIGCFEFTKMFYNLKLIEIDKDTCKTLKLSLSNYLKIIDKIYGKINFINGY